MAAEVSVRVRVQAPPVGGRANEALVQLLARVLGLARGAVEIERGQRARLKTVRVIGLDEEEVKKRLGGAASRTGQPRRAG